MSAKAVGWALEQNTGGDPGAKLVLIALADHHNKSTGRCFPSRALLAKEAMCSESTVDRKLALLQKLGFITVERRYRANGSQTSNQYVLVTGEGANLTPPTNQDTSSVDNFWEEDQFEEGKSDPPPHSCDDPPPPHSYDDPITGRYEPSATFGRTPTATSPTPRAEPVDDDSEAREDPMEWDEALETWRNPSRQMGEVPEHDLMMPHFMDKRATFGPGEPDDGRWCPPNCPYRLWWEETTKGTPGEEGHDKT